MKPVCAAMIRAAQRWCHVSISDIEHHQFKLLRAKLDLDPHQPPSPPTGRRGGELALLLEPELFARQLCPDNPGADLCEGNLACRGGIIAERGETAVIASSQPV